MAFAYHPQFQSAFLPDAHDLIVYLPPDYGETDRRYPVLYMQDGQNLFDPATAFGGCDWAMHTTADRLITEGAIEPLLIVGIGNAGEHRIREYTPDRDPVHRDGGKAPRYVRMLVNEIQPFIDSQYLTKTGPGDTGIGGSSLGGLLSLYAAIRHPNVFGKVAAMSPSVWWHDRVILRIVEKKKRLDQLRIWLDIGTEEGQSPERIVADLRALRGALVQKGLEEGRSLAYVEAEGASHCEAAWRDRTDGMLRFLFPV